MGLHGLAIVAACATTVVAQPVLATSPAPLGRFGLWEAWSSPPMLAPVGQARAEMAASLRAYGKDVSWSVHVRADGYTITVQDKHCHQRVALPAAGISAVTIADTLKKQTEAARRCSRRTGLEPMERLNFSPGDLQEALLVVRPIVGPKRRS